LNIGWLRLLVISHIEIYILFQILILKQSYVILLGDEERSVAGIVDLSELIGVALECFHIITGVFGLLK
jgi:hypothetical protein